MATTIIKLQSQLDKHARQLDEIRGKFAAYKKKARLYDELVKKLKMKSKKKKTKKRKVR